MSRSSRGDGRRGAAGGRSSRDGWVPPRAVPRGRAVGRRSYRPLFPHLARAKVSQLALEFASREMAEIELAREIKAPMGLAVGLVDVKNTWAEPPQLVAERLRTVLKYIEPERVHVTPDCGFSQTARFIATKKLAAMVEGVRLVRRGMGGCDAHVS